jgi:hypothetical protein
VKSSFLARIPIGAASAALLISMAPIANAAEPANGVYDVHYVLVNVEPVARRKLVRVTRIVSSDRGAVSKAEGTVIPAKTRSIGDTLILEFGRPLPVAASMITIDSDLSLGDGACDIRAGRYSIDYSQSKTGLVQLPMQVSSNKSSAAVREAAHKRRRSRNIG